jgi:hypothetical protein
MEQLFFKSTRLNRTLYHTVNVAGLENARELLKKAHEVRRQDGQNRDKVIEFGLRSKLPLVNIHSFSDEYREGIILHLEINA